MPWKRDHYVVGTRSYDLMLLERDNNVSETRSYGVGTR